MTSWRDTASRQAQADLDGLLGPSLEFARQMLEAHGEFYPYAVVVDDTGQQRMVAADSEDDRPQSGDVINMLVAALSADRAQLRAAAIVADVRLTQTGGDAVRVSLEHAERVALTVVLPYVSRAGGGVDYSDLQAGPATPVIWPH